MSSAAAVLRILIFGLACAALACGPKSKRGGAPAGPPPGVEPQVPPILPADKAVAYAVGDTTPRDVLVAQVVGYGQLPWVEALSGAAGRLALHPPARPDLLDARWASAVAGYPHPVIAVVVGEESAGAFPVGLVDALRTRLQAGDHVGLARARVLERDRWIALVGRPVVELPTFSREHAKGAALRLNADRPGQWRLVSPEGGMHNGELPVNALLDVDGEWWLEIETAEGRMGLPLFVDMATPPAPLLSSAGERLGGPAETEARALATVNELRAAFGAPALAVDAPLRALCRQPLDELRAARFDPDAAVSRLRGAGFVSGPVAALGCTAATVPGCIDAWLSTAQTRAQLLNPAVGVAGLCAEPSTDGVRLVLQVAAP